MEQFHGPTCAFKDVALQFVGNMFEFFLGRKRSGSVHADDDTPTSITVVGATSGDTGSAAIEGLRGKAGIECVAPHSPPLAVLIHDTRAAAVVSFHVRCCVVVRCVFCFCDTHRLQCLVTHPLTSCHRLLLLRRGRVFILHPKGRVAAVQEAQMTSVLDANVHNVAVEGTFDDCQSIVKELFSDPIFRAKHNLAAINSINWARILAQVGCGQCTPTTTTHCGLATVSSIFSLSPSSLSRSLLFMVRSQRTVRVVQVVYYFNGYLQCLRSRNVPLSALPPMEYCVPSGNFGNALACFYARAMGLPVSRIVVATNANDILHRWVTALHKPSCLPVSHSLPSSPYPPASSLPSFPSYSISLPLVPVLRRSHVICVCQRQVLRPR
jgi:hypothetical protein